MSMVLIDSDDLQKMITAAVQVAVQETINFTSMNPLTLMDKAQLMKTLGIGATKASELLNRDDFPVIREFGRPRIPLHSLMIWIDEHTEWIRDNANNYHRRSEGIV